MCLTAAPTDYRMRNQQILSVECADCDVLKY